KRSGEVVTVGETVSVMDRETLEIVELPVPAEEEIRSRIEPGVNVEYWVVMGRRMISYVRRE
ncbi:MAG: translation initiation factor IF-5A, partial [Nitrososphaerota archaeon]